MGNPKQKWTAAEEEALIAGISKYGAGKWKLILRDPDFLHILHSRSNIDLKDKWRNMSAAAGQGSRDKSRTSKPKLNSDSPSTPSVTIPTPALVHVAAHESPVDPVKDDPAKELTESKNGPRYNDMIFELLSATREPNGLDIGSIVTYIEQRTEVPQNFRKQLGSKLRKLVLQEKLEKVDSCYRLKNSSLSKTNSTIRKENWSRQTLTTAQIKAGESLEEAAKTAAYKVAEAENASIAAAAAVKEAEKIAKMAEEADLVLQLSNEFLERCSRGEITMLA